MSETPTTKQIAAVLRRRVLQLSPEDIGLNRDNDCPSILGAVIETSHPDAVASLVILSDGSVSLYVSNGNGCVGCGNNDEIRRAAAALLPLADRALPLTTPTQDLALPPAGLVRCYLLTTDGLRFTQLKFEEINRIDPRVSELYFAAQRVMTAIERVGAGQSLSHELKKALAERDDGSAPISPLANSPLTKSPGSSQCLSVGNAVLRLRS